MLPSVLHVVSSTSRQPPGVLKILIPRFEIESPPPGGYAALREDGIIVSPRDGFTSAISGLSVIVIDGGGNVINPPPFSLSPPPPSSRICDFDLGERSRVTTYIRKEESEKKVKRSGCR